MLTGSEWQNQGCRAQSIKLSTALLSFFALMFPCKSTRDRIKGFNVAYSWVNRQFAWPGGLLPKVKMCSPHTRSTLHEIAFDIKGFLVWVLQQLLDE